MNEPALFLWIALVIGYALLVFSFTSDIKFATDISSLSCIKMDKSDAEKFDWSSIQSDGECRRCLFAMANILGNPEAMAEWFKARVSPM